LLTAKSSFRICRICRICSIFRIFGASLPQNRRQKRFERIHTVHFAKIPHHIDDDIAAITFNHSTAVGAAGVRVCRWRTGLPLANPIKLYGVNFVKINRQR